LATFKLEILAYRAKISCGQFLFLESLMLGEIKNKFLPHGIPTLQARISGLKVANLRKIL
jgi:hypothetical protein